MMKFFYNGTYDLPGDDPENRTHTGSLTFHAEMYAMADKFGAAELEVIASKLFNEVLEHSSLEEAVATAPTVYDMTPATNRTLRDMLVWKVGSEWEEISRPRPEGTPENQYQRIIDSVEQTSKFCLDIAVLVGQRLDHFTDIASVPWKCPECNKTFTTYFKSLVKEGAYCRTCQKRSEFNGTLLNSNKIQESWPHRPNKLSKSEG